MAAWNGRIEVVRSLLAANADSRIVSSTGTSTLSDAKRKNHPAIAGLLEARLAELADKAPTPVVSSGSGSGSGSALTHCI